MQVRLPLFRFPLLLLMLLVFGCTNKRSPADVAKLWLNDFHNLDFEDAKKYSSDETKNTLSLAQLFLTTLPDSAKKLAKKVTIDIKATKENGNNAIVTYTTSKNPLKEITINLTKLNDRWVVQFTKNDMNAMARKDDATTATPTIQITQGAPTATDSSVQTPEADSNAIPPTDDSEKH